MIGYALDGFPVYGPWHDDGACTPVIACARSLDARVGRMEPNSPKCNMVPRSARSFRSGRSRKTTSMSPNQAIWMSSTGGAINGTYAYFLSSDNAGNLRIPIYWRAATTVMFPP